jgi:hypothetical protein
LGLRDQDDIIGFVASKELKFALLWKGFGCYRGLQKRKTKLKICHNLKGAS